MTIRDTTHSTDMQRVATAAYRARHTSPAPSPGTIARVHNLGWSVVKNSAAQIVGRLLISLSRLAIAGIIIRSSGNVTFGQYSLVFGILATADWLVDFGTTDVFVRDISREPAGAPRLMRVLTAAKFVQVPAAFVIVAAALLALKYPSEIVQAGVVGALALVFYGGVSIYRVVFRSALVMEREVAAELLSVLTLIPMIAVVCFYAGGGLVALAACHVGSRAVYYGACFLFGRTWYKPSIEGVGWRDVGSRLRSSAAIGAIGFLVGGYETLDILVLSKSSDFSQVAYYSGAQRLVWPVLMALGAVAATFYPVLSSYWSHSRLDFENAFQRSIDVVFTLAGFALCSVLAGAEFFMTLLGPDLQRSVPVLRVLGVLCLLKAITSSVGPVFYVVKAQKRALQFIMLAVVMKAIVMWVLAPRYGYIGVAFSALAVEAAVATVAVWSIQRITGYRVKWNVISRIALITVVAAVSARLLVPSGGLMAAVAAPVLYIPLALLTNSVRLAEVRALIEANR